MLLPEIAKCQCSCKELSLISPVIEATEVFRATETAIPVEVIEQTIGKLLAI